MPLTDDHRRGSCAGWVDLQGLASLGQFDVMGLRGDFVLPLCGPVIDLSTRDASIHYLEVVEDALRLGGRG